MKIALQISSNEPVNEFKASPVEIDNACVSKKRAEKCGVIFDIYREPITLAETPVLIDQLVVLYFLQEV
ncbi:hypothetical protein P5673_028647 [Acropora cervicornis]|uniref:Uncharacterized protein n=1 Tax=Acropora cervicornis TaxID=6130 RepID=A0AAD9PWQ7_ACRCE|nr:hypothetical protein P5673_028647 [Acropora cervicornis]